MFFAFKDGEIIFFEAVSGGYNTEIPEATGYSLISEDIGTLTFTPDRSSFLWEENNINCSINEEYTVNDVLNMIENYVHP